MQFVAEQGDDGGLRGAIGGWTSPMPGSCSPAERSRSRISGPITERTVSLPPDTLAGGAWFWSGHRAMGRVASFP
jgi:hypothetical protein